MYYRCLLYIIHCRHVLFATVETHRYNIYVYIDIIYMYIYRFKIVFHLTSHTGLPALEMFSLNTLVEPNHLRSEVVNRYTCIVYS